MHSINNIITLLYIDWLRDGLSKWNNKRWIKTTHKGHNTFTWGEHGWSRADFDLERTFSWTDSQNHFWSWCPSKIRSCMPCKVAVFSKSGSITLSSDQDYFVYRMSFHFSLFSSQKKLKLKNERSFFYPIFSWIFFSSRQSKHWKLNVYFSFFDSSLAKVQIENGELQRVEIAFW